MPHEIYANGHEVVAEAGDSVTEWSEPDGSVSSASATDTMQGSRSVVIGGKPIMQRDKSFLKTRTDGVVSGSSVFRSWSMNVFVEGYNVCRGGDSTTSTHNDD